MKASDICAEKTFLPVTLRKSRSARYEEVFDKGIRVRSDFDTGNPEYAVFDEAACRTVAGGAEGIGYASA